VHTGSVGSVTGVAGIFVVLDPLATADTRARRVSVLLVSRSACGGTGNASAGRNHHARNHVNLSRVVGTKWTALERTFGWRHFEVKEYMHVLKADPGKKNGKQTYVLLEATCDASARLWVDIEILKSRRVWSAGWLQKETLQRLLEEEEDHGAQTPCRACGGGKVMPCRYCCTSEPISLF
jgi:tryptophan-rich hypothetical protein